MVTGTTVAPERVHTDEVSECDDNSECGAEARVMFGGPNQPLDVLVPLPPAVEVDFHIIVPESLQDTTASLMETLKESETQLEVAVEGTVMAASMASLMPPVTRSAPAPPPIDCVGVWSECTAECEPADARDWTEVTAQV